MNPRTKGLLIGGTVLLLGTIVMVAVGRSAKEAPGDMNTAPEKAGAAETEIRALEGEGMMFGRDISESQCLAETVARYQTDTGLSNAIEQTNFIEGVYGRANRSGFMHRRSAQQRIFRRSEMASFALPDTRPR